MSRHSSDAAPYADTAQAKPSGAAETRLTLTFPQLDRTITTLPGETIFQSARRNGLRIVGACGGRGICGTCTVLIRDGQVRDRAGRVLAPRARADNTPRGRWLRSCQAIPLTDCIIDIEERSLAPVVRAETDVAGSETLPLDPLVTNIEINPPAPSLMDPRSDVERATQAMANPDARIDAFAARQLSTTARTNAWSFGVMMRGDEAIGFTPARTRMLGLAIDLGTTNVAGFLIDLRSGRRLATLGLENPQVAWGADVISRINHAIRDTAAAEQLRVNAVAAIEALAHDVCQAVGATPSDIADVAVCGNTAMHHLLLGLPVRQLGQSPFVAAVCNAIDIKARDLGLDFVPGAYVHLAPNVGGFVGGDHVAALLATEAQCSAAATSVVMDIGTNTEISLIHRGEINTASCPSGPALEGGHISCGMRAADGAIEHVSIRDQRIAVDVIGNKPPIGVCGSGVLDTVATLYRAGLLRNSGRLVGPHPDIEDEDGRRAFRLTPKVRFSQDDIRSVQLAKAAIQTGLEILLGEAGITADNIDCFILAGAFGAYIDVASGIAIGLFPPLPLNRFNQVGNAAGLGARLMLTSRHARARATELARRCRYIELSTRQQFQKMFMRNIAFPPAPHGEYRDQSKPI